jgi:dipeptidyl aminopeptidase/acylaminoacyl peptidase
VEAQDEGDPNKEADIRDKAFFSTAPFTENSLPDISFKLRAGGITWGSDGLAIAYEWWWTTREMITSSFVPGKEDSKEVIFERSFEDSYNDPGDFETRQNEYGNAVLLTDKSGKKLYLTGTGASPEGNRPFVREFDLAKKETEEFWRSEAPYYEYPIRILDLKKNMVLTRRESKEDPPNYYLRDMKKGKLTQLTDFPHPYPQLKGIEKQVVQYQRNDGLDLKGDLYLPTDFTPGEDDPLPVIMWAYPEEFKSADAAGQVQGSPYEFIRLGWWSPLYFITQGYAIFDDPSMPVVGEGDEEPNDTFREQLVENGRAAIQKLEEMGVGDPDRVAIGGHSYGAFMTANLLAHSDLFATGIARSGAYNRTLTPFGFQAEERTYWDSPEVYYTMSPFMHADKINEPMLMIHGEADNNSGTFPLQSERMFAAMKGLGGTARLVMLPHESHGYRAQESILHMLWEMNEWLELYVKNKKEE